MSSTLKSLSASVPSAYDPYPTLVLCSNTLSDVEFPIEVAQQKPLLIGRGSGLPTVWIAAPTDITRQTWSWVVDKNSARHPKFKVDESDRTVMVTAGATKVLEVTALNENLAEVVYLDLRPIGLRIHGDRTALHAGGNTLERTMVGGSYVFLGFG